jgi:hypothetical protein
MAPIKEPVDQFDHVRTMNTMLCVSRQLGSRDETQNLAGGLGVIVNHRAPVNRRADVQDRPARIDEPDPGRAVVTACLLTLRKEVQLLIQLCAMRVRIASVASTAL